MSEFCYQSGDYNPCYIPPPPGGHSDPQFDPEFFLFFASVCAVPLIALTLGIVVVAARKAGTTNARVLAVSTLVPPSIFGALFLYELFFGRGIRHGFEYMFLGPGRVLELPLIVTFYLTTILTTFVFHQIRSRISPATSDSQ